MNRNQLINLLISILILCSPLALKAQKEKAKILLKDSTVLHGFAKIKKDNTIKFRTDKKSASKIYDYRDIQKAVIKYRTYVYKIRVDTKMKIPLLLRVERKGYISLYSQDYQVQYGAGVMGPIGSAGPLTISAGFSPGFTEQKYYLCRDNSLFVEFACATGGNRNKKFRKFALSYFKDCPEICEKIKNKTYGRNDIGRIVKAYNSFLKNRE